MPKFHDIVLAATSSTGLSVDVVTKLLVFIDRQKILGYVKGMASSRFGDYLGFLQLPDNECTAELFADRWADPRVWIDIPDELKRYLNNDTPLFTVSRLEPGDQPKSRPFYEQGLTKVLTGDFLNPEDGSSVRKTPPLKEDYSVFIVNCNLPQHFYLHVLNVNLEAILSKGLPRTDYAGAHKIYPTASSSVDALYKDLAARRLVTSQKSSGSASHKISDFTILRLATDSMELDTDYFYTKTLHSREQGSRSYGYLYTGLLKPEGIKVST